MAPRSSPGQQNDLACIANQRKLADVHVGIQRLTTLYGALLNRPPSKEEILASRSAIEGRLGMLQAMISVGLSREACRRPGWLSRLVHCADASQGAPPTLRRWLTQPAIEIGRAHV